MRESVEQAAIRELKEEIGYTGKIIRISPKLPLHQGISNTYTHLVHIEIDGNKYKVDPEQVLQDGEFIKVIKINKIKLFETLYKFSNDEYLIDPKLFTWAFMCNI